MKIEILGTGCAKCNQLEQATRQAAEKLGLIYELDHIREIKEISRRGVIFTPALVVDGKVLAAGRVPSAEELARLLGKSA